MSRKIGNKIVKLESRLLCSKASTYLLRIHQIRKPLAELYQNNVVVLIDKASDNGAKTSVKYYRS